MLIIYTIAKSKPIAVSCVIVSMSCSDIIMSLAIHSLHYTVHAARRLFLGTIRANIFTCKIQGLGYPVAFCANYPLTLHYLLTIRYRVSHTFLRRYFEPIMVAVLAAFPALSVILTSKKDQFSAICSLVFYRRLSLWL